MLSLSHATTGAFIATKLGNPALAIPLILLSHYLEDAIPHYDAGTGLSRGTKTRKTAFIWGVIDLTLAAVLVLAMYPHLGFRIWDLGFWRQTPIWGAFFGLLPDFLEAPRNFLHYEPSWLKPINQFHGSFHHSIPKVVVGLAPQVILLSLLWLYR